MFNLFYSKPVFFSPPRSPEQAGGARETTPQQNELKMAKKVLTEGLGLKPTPDSASSRVLSDEEAKTATRKLSMALSKAPELAQQLDKIFELLKLVKIDFAQQDALQVRFLKDRKTNSALQIYVARKATKWTVLKKIPDFTVFRKDAFATAFLDNTIVPKGAKISMAKNRNVPESCKVLMAKHKLTSLTTLVILAQQGSRTVQEAVLKRPELGEGRLDIIMRSLGKKPNDMPLYRELAKHPNVTNSLANDMWVRFPALKTDLAFNSHLAHNKKITGDVIKKIIDNFPSSSPIMAVINQRNDLGTDIKAYLKKKMTPGRAA